VRRDAAEPSSGAVRSQLQRILHSNLFMCSQRLSACLRYVVELTLDGEGSSLKEQVLGSELHGKGPEIDGSAGPIVRVYARRLRDKLREYYSEFPPPTSGPRLTFSASGSFSGFGSLIHCPCHWS